MAWIGALVRTRILALPGVLSVASCGAGTASVVAGASDDDGSSAPPVIAAFAIDDPKEPEKAAVRFTLSRRASVELLYQLANGPVQPMTQLGQNPRVFEAGSVTLAWNFALEPELEASFREGVLIFATIAGVLEHAKQGENAVTIGLGNDPPVIERASRPPSSEVAGIAALRLRVSDSSGDAVSIRAEYDVVGDDPDLGWRIARPGGLLPGESTPGFAFASVIAPTNGVDLDFFWNTDVDLEDREEDALVRFTAVDPVVAGPTRETEPFRVDNNQEPILQMGEAAIVLNPDQRRGIPVPFRVLDEEGDRVEVTAQWRRADGEFPTLDLDGDGELENSDLDAILADTGLRREKQICTRYPRFAHGHVLPVDGAAVRLPEIATDESWILSSGLEGRTLELLRPSGIPAPITPSWSSNPLVAPVAALSVGDGLTAIVLDAPGVARLREVELATGVVVREVAAFGPGVPTSMTLERGERAVLVASQTGGSWRLRRVDVATGGVTELFASDGSMEPPPVRGMASLGKGVVALTAGSALLSLDYAGPLVPGSTTILDGLATPWGVVVDPLNDGRLYLAERDAPVDGGTGRILAIDVHTHERQPVVTDVVPVQAARLELPEAIALGRMGARLLVVARGPGGDAQLVGLDLGGQDGNRPFVLGPPAPGGFAGVASGPDGLLLLARPTVDEMWCGGGLEQRRTITSYAPGSQRATADVAFHPLPRPGQAWRIPSLPVCASSEGVETSFVWDASRDLTSEPSVVLRVIPRDEELGIMAEGTIPKDVRTGLDAQASFLGGPATMDGPFLAIPADLDTDGDADIVSANLFGHTLTAFFQRTAGAFDPAPLVLGGLPTMNGPGCVDAADLDGDGDVDLISANSNSHNLTGFFQTTPGVFDAPVLVIGGSTSSAPVFVTAADLDGDGVLDLAFADPGNDDLRILLQSPLGSFSDPVRLVVRTFGLNPRSVAAADLDRDGDLDLVSANASDNLTAFFQLGPGTFDPTPLVLGGSANTDGCEDVEIADLDADGDADLVAANEMSKSLAVFFQGAPGDFSAAPLVLGQPRTAFFPRTAAASDVDGDGDLDLLSANGTADHVAVFFQETPGTFDPSFHSIGDPVTTDRPETVAAADLDGDGDQDLLTANTDGDDLTVFFQATRGSFHSDPQRVFVPGGVTSAGSNPMFLEPADLDADGLLDLVSVSNFTDNLAIFWQRAPGNFDSVPLVLGGFPTTDSVSSAVAVDLDGDGDQDLVSANAGRDDITVFVQSAPGRLETALTLGGLPATDSPVSVDAADLDGDGDLDLVTANVAGDDLTGFFQQAPGIFDRTPLSLGDSSTTDGPTFVAANDLDADGDQDLVSANVFGDSLAVFYQSSPGTFDSTPRLLGRFPVTDSPSSLVVADLDGDGDRDLASVNSQSDNLTLFLQRMSATFDPEPMSLGDPATTNAPLSIGAADLDGDGDEDLVAANYVGQVTVFRQTAPGAFGPAPLVLGGALDPSGWRHVAAVDLDGDGDPDVVAVDELDNYLTVFWGGR